MVSINAYPLALRTTTSSSSQIKITSPGIHVIIEVTAISLTPSVVPTIRGLNKRTGNFYDILVGTAITATGTTVLKVRPGIAVSADTKSDGLPEVIDIEMAHGDTDPITYSVDVEGIN